jgi:hypothetical protein
MRRLRPIRAPAPTSEPPVTAARLRTRTRTVSGGSVTHTPDIHPTMPAVQITVPAAIRVAPRRFIGPVRERVREGSTEWISQNPYGSKKAWVSPNARSLAAASNYPHLGKLLCHAASYNSSLDGG